MAEPLKPRYTCNHCHEGCGVIATPAVCPICRKFLCGTCEVQCPETSDGVPRAVQDDVDTQPWKAPR